MDFAARPAGAGVAGLAVLALWCFIFDRTVILVRRFGDNMQGAGGDRPRFSSPSFRPCSGRGRCTPGCERANALTSVPIANVAVPSAQVPPVQVPPVQVQAKPPTSSVALLSHLRWLAAFIVVCSHVTESILNIGAVGPSTPYLNTQLDMRPVLGFTGYAQSAVVVFFVLSGFLVGGKLLGLLKTDAIEQDWRVFLVDRFSRIFVVLIPCLLLTAIVLAGLLSLVPDAHFVQGVDWALGRVQPLQTDVSLQRWAASAVMLNELLAPTLDTNSPLWSLSYEWSYYIIGLALVLLVRRVPSTPAIVAIGYGVVLLGLSLVNQPNVLFESLSWIAGVAARVAFNHRVLRGRLLQVAGVGAVVVAVVLTHRYSLPSPCLGLAVAFLVAHPGWRTMHFGAGIGEWLANFSYSLYCVHFPLLLGIMGIMVATGSLPHRLEATPSNMAITAAIVVLLAALAWLFAGLTERHTAKVRDALLNALGLHRVRLKPSPA